MNSIDRLLRRVILGCAILMFAPQIVLLVAHLVREIVSQPSAASPDRSVHQNGGFVAGMIIGLAVLVLVAGLLARLGTFLRNRDPYRKALDRRAHSLPRYPADLPEDVPSRSTVDDGDDPAFR